MKGKNNMKKLITCLTLFTMMSAVVSCGSTDSDSSASSAKASLPATTVSTETTVTSQENASPTSTAQTANTAGGNTAETAVATENTSVSTNDLEFATAEYLFGGYVSTDSDSLNLRSKPDVDSSILSQIPSQTQLDIYSCDTPGWYQTVYDGKSGYVSAEYIANIYPDNSTDSTADQPNEYGFYTVTSDPRPGTAGPVLTSLTGTFSDGNDIYTFYDCSAYDGKFSVKYADGTTLDGYAKVQYLIQSDNYKDYWYVLYDNSSKLAGSFRFMGDMPLNELNDGMRTFTRIN